MKKTFRMACFATLALSLAGCVRLSNRDVSEAYNITGGGNARLGRYEIQYYGCQTCHTIGGVSGARGLIGPPLDGIGERSYIAGELPNTPDNLERWIQHPRSVEPHTVMPEMNVSESDSRDIAAYLYTLPSSESRFLN
jgi:cytochrome c